MPKRRGKSLAAPLGLPSPKDTIPAKETLVSQKPTAIFASLLFALLAFVSLSQFLLRDQHQHFSTLTLSLELTCID